MFTPLDLAAKLQDEVAKYVYNENRVPKKYRYTLGADLIRKTDELFDNASYANEIWLTPKTAPERKKYWVRASANVKQLDRRLQRLRNVVDGATVENMKEILRLLNEERGALSERIKNE